MKLLFLLPTALVLVLLSSVAHAGPVCIQDDTNGNALVLQKSTFKRGKAGAASGYMAVYTPTGFVAKAITVSTVTSTGGYVGIGVTEYPPVIAKLGSVNSIQTTFYNIACTLGTDGKISVLDPCTAIVTVLGGGAPQSRDMHVVECVDEYRIP